MENPQHSSQFINKIVKKLILNVFINSFSFIIQSQLCKEIKKRFSLTLFSLLVFSKIIFPQILHTAVPTVLINRGRSSTHTQMMLKADADALPSTSLALEPVSPPCRRHLFAWKAHNHRVSCGNLYYLWSVCLQSDGIKWVAQGWALVLVLGLRRQPWALLELSLSLGSLGFCL